MLLGGPQICAVGGLCLGGQNGCLREGLMSPSSPRGGAGEQAACVLSCPVLSHVPLGEGPGTWLSGKGFFVPSLWPREWGADPEAQSRRGRFRREGARLIAWFPWLSSAFPGHS